MLAHGATELTALAGRCLLSDEGAVNGWAVQMWRLGSADVDAAVDVYAAVLEGGATDEVVNLLAEAKVDLVSLLIDDEHSKDGITRSDFTELLGAATLLAAGGWSTSQLHMPNIPMMSRRKSDSGIDVMAVEIAASPSSAELQPDERLAIASVKHTVDTSSSGMRWKLVESLGSRELSRVYLAGQLRVLDGRLRMEGYTKAAAARAFLFLRDFPATGLVELVAVGAVAPRLEADLRAQVDRLPEAQGEEKSFRMVVVPDLDSVHEKCP